MENQTTFFTSVFIFNLHRNQCHFVLQSVQKVTLKHKRESINAASTVQSVLMGLISIPQVISSIQNNRRNLAWT